MHRTTKNEGIIRTLTVVYSELNVCHLSNWGLFLPVQTSEKEYQLIKMIFQFSFDLFVHFFLSLKFNIRDNLVKDDFKIQMFHDFSACYLFSYYKSFFFFDKNKKIFIHSNRQNTNFFFLAKTKRYSLIQINRINQIQTSLKT